MRIILIVITLCLLSGVIQAQRPDKDIRISLDAKNETLENILKQIGQQSGMPVSYSHAQVPAQKRISVRIQNKPLQEALKDLLSAHNLDFIFVENQIIIRPISVSQETIEGPPQVSSFTLSGYVKEKGSGEAIVGATIYTEDMKYGTTSNNYGFYSLTLPENTYRIMASFIGYKTIAETFQMNRNQTHHVHLETDEMMLETVIITQREDSNYFVAANQIGFTEMQAQRVSRMPMFLSEADVIKAMHFMPGVSNTIDGSSSYYVRGGTRDQNLILLDDAPIYNPSHLFGFFTSINPEAVTDIKLYKSDFPAYVGGKLSSVLEMKTKEGNQHHFSGGADIGLVTGRLSFEGPIIKERSSFYLSYRTSYLGYLLTALDEGLTDFNFDDFNAKFNFRINDKNRLLFSYYAGNDNFFNNLNQGDRQGINWSNRASSLRWNRIVSSRLFSNTTLYYSHYDYNLYTSYNQDIRWSTGIKTVGLKNDFSFFKNPKTTHYFGFLFKANTFEPGLYINHNFPHGFLPDIQTMETGESHLYYSSERNLGKKFTLRYGLRATLFSNKGPAEWFTIDDNYQIKDTVRENSGRYNEQVHLSPSVTCTYLLNNRNSVKLNYFRAYQYHQILSNTISPFTSVEIWYPSTPNVKPQAVDQLSLGYFSNFRHSIYSFSLEGFYKIMHNQFDYGNQASFILNPQIEKELRFGKTKAYGAEVLLKKDVGKLQGWLGYAHTRASKTIEDLNAGAPYPAYSDRPHDFSIYIAYKPTARWTISSGFVYATGMPFTSPTGFYNYMGYKVPIYSHKNNARMPDYYRWDIGFQALLSKPESRSKHLISFSLYNVTNKQNPVFINFNKVQDDNGNFIIPANYATDYQLTPSQTILLGVMPGFKYRFKF